MQCSKQRSKELRRAPQRLPLLSLCTNVSGSRWPIWRCQMSSSAHSSRSFKHTWARPILWIKHFAPAYYRNNSARADFCGSLRQIIRALQNGAVQSKNNYAAIGYCNILLPVSSVTVLGGIPSLSRIFAFTLSMVSLACPAVSSGWHSQHRIFHPKKKKNQILTTKIRNGHDNTFQKWFKEFLHRPPHQKLVRSSSQRFDEDLHLLPH